MGYNKSKKANGYEIAPSIEPSYQFEGVSIINPPTPDSDRKNKKKMMKKKKCFLLCCSNLEFNNEAVEKDEVMEILNNNKFQKLCLVMCCASLEAGQRSDMEHNTSK